MDGSDLPGGCDALPPAPAVVAWPVAGASAEPDMPPRRWMRLERDDESPVGSDDSNNLIKGCSTKIIQVQRKDCSFNH